jgi:hypothetical protein
VGRGESKRNQNERNDMKTKTYQCVGVVNVRIKAESADAAAKQYAPLDIWSDVVEVSVFKIKNGKAGSPKYFRIQK